MFFVSVYEYFITSLKSECEYDNQEDCLHKSSVSCKLENHSPIGRFTNMHRPLNVHTATTLGKQTISVVCNALIIKLLLVHDNGNEMHFRLALLVKIGLEHVVCLFFA